MPHSRLNSDRSVLFKGSAAAVSSIEVTCGVKELERAK